MYMDNNQNTNSFKSIYQYRKQLIFNYGLTASGVMMAFLLFMEFTDNHGPFVNFMSYIPLAIILFVALKDLKTRLPKDRIFIKGLPLGLGISLVAASFLTVLNICLIIFAPSHSFHAFGIEPVSLNQEVMMTSIFFVETFVYGAIITFILLQFLKERITL